MSGSVASGKFTGDVFWNVASLILLAAGGLAVNALIVMLRGSDALGVFNQVYAVYIVLSQIGVGGLQHSVLKQVSHNQNDVQTCSHTTFVALLLVFIVTVPISAAGILLADIVGQLVNSQDVAAGLVYAMPGLVFFSANKVLVNVLNGLSHMRVYALFRSLRFILIPGFIVILILMDNNSNSLPLALTLTELVLFIFLLVYVYSRVLVVRIPQNFGQYAKQHMSYGIRGVLSGVLIELNTRVDVLMVGLFMTDRMVGIYSFAAILAEGFAQLPIAVRYNVDPLLGQHFAMNQRQRITVLSKRIRRFFLPAIAFVGVGSVAVYPLLYWLMAGADGLHESWTAFAILTVAHIAVAGYSPMRGILLQGNAPGAYTVTILVSSFGNIVLNLLLIPLVGIQGAAIATGFAIVLEIMIIVALAYRLFKTHL